MPFAAFITLLLLISLTRRASDGSGLMMVLPLALAASHTLDRLSRSVASFMDWFSLLIFGALATAGWLYWTAAMTGSPAAAARVMARWAPGFTFEFQFAAFCIAVAFTLLWIYAVARAHRNNRRAIVNWAAGVTLVWVVAVLLGLPALDHRLSYRSTAAAIAAVVKETPNTCIASQNLGDSQRASFNYFAGLRFTPVATPPATVPCNWLLVQGLRNDIPATDAAWQLAWEGARPGDNDERLRLYRRAPAGNTATSQ